MMDGLQARPELADVANDLMNGGLQAYVEIDRDAAARLGIDTTNIVSVLQSAFGSGRSQRCSPRPTSTG